MAFKLTYKPYGEHAILVEWPAVIKESVLYDLLGFKDVILNASIKQIIDIKTAYNSLLITYNLSNNDFNNKTNILKALYITMSKSVRQPYQVWKIPVCYDACFGLDIEDISVRNKITKENIIKRHTGIIYTVYFIGFLPGFLYLGELDERLNIPRKSTPRLKVEKGAVAIGGSQTGIYPNESPGGWQIIGNSPISFFNPKSTNPCFANAGDKIIFYPITINKHTDIKTLISAGVYQVESEVING